MLSLFSLRFFLFPGPPRGGATRTNFSACVCVCVCVCVIVSVLSYKRGVPSVPPFLFSGAFFLCSFVFDRLIFSRRLDFVFLFHSQFKRNRMGTPEATLRTRSEGTKNCRERIKTKQKSKTYTRQENAHNNSKKG